MNVVLTVSSHTASVHWGGGSIQGENRVLGKFLDSPLLCFVSWIQEQTEVFRHRGSHSALRHRAGNRLGRLAWDTDSRTQGREKKLTTVAAKVTYRYRARLWRMYMRCFISYRSFSGGSRGGRWQRAEEIQGRVCQRWVRWGWTLVTVWNTSATIRHCRTWSRGIL